MPDIAERLPLLLPLAVAWAESCALQIAADGVPLTPARQEIARRVGVNAPEKVRIAYVTRIPLPEDPVLREAAHAVGLLGHAAGLTLGYGIYIAADCDSDRLIAHECRHVQQYETFGSIAAFLSVYLPQVVQYGYCDAPLEIDARRYEQVIAG